jgi:hypothetical protein
MWFPDLNQGRGYPFLAFYAPLVFFAAAALHSLGASLALSLKLVVVLGMAAGASGAYRLLRLGFAPCGAIAGAALCSYAPYHVRDLTIRGDLAEFVAASFLPWSLFAVLRLARKHRPGDVVLAAALGTLPVLTHNIVALFGGGVMVVAAAAAVAVSPRKLATAAAAACAGAGTLALSAFFWLPALVERRFVRIDAMTEGVYDVERNFLSIRDLFATPAVPGIGQQLPMSFELGWPALAALAFVPFAVRGASGMRAALLMLGAAASLVGLVMTMPAGAAIYDAVPLLRFVQFPWRFLVLVTLGLGLLGGAGLGAFLAGRPPRVRAAVAGAAAIAAVAAVSPLLGPKAHGEIPHWSVDPDELARGRQTATGWASTNPAGPAKHPPPASSTAGSALPRASASRAKAAAWDATSSSSRATLRPPSCSATCTTRVGRRWSAGGRCRSDRTRRTASWSSRSGRAGTKCASAWRLRPCGAPPASYPRRPPWRSSSRSRSRGAAADGGQCAPGPPGAGAAYSPRTTPTFSSARSVHHVGSNSNQRSPCRAERWCAWWLLCHPSPQEISATHQLFRESSPVGKL